MSDLLAFFQRYQSPAWTESVDGRLLVINSPSLSISRLIAQQHKQVDYFTHLAYLPHADSALEPESHYDDVLLFMPKEKALAELLITTIKDRLSDDAQLFIIGDKRSGIKSLNKIFPVELNKIESHSHCLLFQGSYSADAFDKTLDDFYQNYSYSGINISNLPGVFSFQSLDKGTAELLPFLKQYPADSVLDFGCGSGIIACHYKQNHPTSSVDALDANTFAIASALRTAANNALELNHVFQSDGFDKVSQRYDLIISNPPFHQGQEQTYAVSENLIKQSTDYLKPNGRLLIVANRFLPYEKWIQQCFNKADNLFENNQFKVILAKYPK